jgi:Chromo (CHRromatin Organisation MOdifier) domain
MDCIVTFTDRLGSDIRLIPCKTSITAPELASLFFKEWYCENGLPLDIVSDRDKLFVSTFWRSLHKLTGTKLKMSTAYHPETDGSSERTNKTVNQCLRFFVECNQRGWVRALPLIRFNIMNTVNKSTGFSPFQLRMGRSPRLIPPLVDSPSSCTGNAEIQPQEIIRNVELITKEAQDNLLRAKISQSFHANKSRSLTFPFRIGDRVRLSTFNRRREYKSSGDKRVAKFMPRFDGPYTILNTDPTHSTVTLDVPNSPNTFHVFHTSEILPFIENDPTLYPSREHAKPPPITTEHGDEEWYIRDIIDERRRGRGFQYLVRWLGYGPEFDRWLPGSELEDTEALDIWLARNKCG